MKPKCKHCKMILRQVRIDESVPDNWYLYRCPRCTLCISWFTDLYFVNHDKQHVLDTIAKGIFFRVRLDANGYELPKDKDEIKLKSGDIFTFSEEQDNWVLTKTAFVPITKPVMEKLDLTPPKSRLAKRLLT